MITLKCLTKLFSVLTVRTENRERGYFMNVAETVVRKNSHNFCIHVTDKGALTFSVDGGEEKHARALEDGKLFFIGVQEVVVRGEIEEWREMVLPEEAYKFLLDAQKRVTATLAEERTISGLKSENKESLLKRVDKWKKKVRHYRKNGKGKRLDYAVHDFTIGAQSYRFFERRIDNPLAWDGIIINPAYKVSRSLDGIGAIPIQKGALTFWCYHDNDQGWYNVRELTLNEMICIEIIHSHGLVREGKI